MERPQPAPPQRPRPPAALPAGSSASVAEPELTNMADGNAAADLVPETSAVVGTSTGQTQAGAISASTAPASTAPASTVESFVVGTSGVSTPVVGTPAVDIPVVTTPPSAGAASPSGMVKPPPLTPLPHDEPAPSGPVDRPEIGPIDGNEAMVSPDDDTAPLPVILPDRMPDSIRPQAQLTDPADPEKRMRDPFEPIERAPTPLPRRVSQAEQSPADARDPAARASAPSPAMAPSPADEPGAAKMDQIKDLYLTAEAIGEDALTQHFQQVSDRQRQLIREYFEQIATHTTDGQPKPSG